MADRRLTIAVWIVLAGFTALPAAPVFAQSDSAAADATEQAARKAEFDSISQEIAVTQERQAALGVEITTIATDRTALNRTLIETGNRAKTLERKIGDTEDRMQKLRASETKLRASLAQRRAVLAEVLAALQRMGRHPPPAIVVRPEDALSSVRSAILLGSVVPDLRVRAEAVAIDLHDLVTVREQLDGERDRLKADAGALAEERTKIGLMIEAKKKAQSDSEQALATERQKAADLAKKADNLKDLISSMEKQLAAASEAAEKARKADEARQAAAEAAPEPAPTSLGSSDRIAPAVAFADAKGLLPKPVSGVDIRGFGEDDGVGGKSQGLSITTRSGAQVTTPADGWVVYAGPFRSYGQLLILNGGGGYHILLAGMERIDVEIGQFVLAGEPVAIMGDHRLASVGAVDIGATQPVLYVEFRKEGTAIDPGPWWARTDDEKVGG